MATTVCLIRPNPPLFAFANALHRRHPWSLVVVEARRPRALSRVWQTVRNLGRGDVEAARQPRRAVSARQAAKLTRFFRDDWRALDPTIPLLVVPDINSPTVRERLQQIRPDVVVDHGTSIVRDELIGSVPLALNIHWGLSPYYRGTHCTEWALINWDPLNVGVTLHRLTRDIDGGGVVAQARAEIAATDSVHAINMQLTHLGCRLAGEALDRIAAGRTLTFHQQDHAQGLLTLNRQWSRPLARQMRHIERAGLIAKMLKHPARKKRLPIIEWQD